MLRSNAWRLACAASGLLLLGVPTGRAVDAPASPSAVHPLTVRAHTVLDGRGQVLHDVVVTLQGGRIVGIAPSAAPADVDLGTRTLLPGGIDTHVHIGWHFARDGKLYDPERKAAAETPAETLAAAAANAAATVQSGITTVQSLGAPGDKELREAIHSGRLPGPRLLTSLEPLSADTGDAGKLRAAVAQRAAQGADVIKIFASQSIRDGGAPTLTQAQLDAACGEARRLHLRSAVHAHGIESVRRATLAGCTSVEHGVLIDGPTLALMAQHGTYFDPNIDLVFRNYFENQAHYLGIGNYTAAGFAQMHDAVPKALAVFQQALRTPGLKIVFGTDAVAGAHGHNFEELVYRVSTGGQQPMAAIVSATSLAAESLGLGHETGSLTPGYAADMIAVDGDPLRDISALLRVVWVMRNGTVLRNDLRQ